MAGKPPKDLIPTGNTGKDDDEKKGEGLCPNDLDALDEFCSSFEFDDIGFEAFCGAHDNLDICLPLMLTPDEIKNGGKRAIEFTRTVKVQTPEGLRITKEKLYIEVSWQSGSSHGDVICIENKGDKDHQDNEGNLLVTLKAS